MTARARTLTLVLLALCGVGCFWLEPIHAYDPDAGGQDPDGGTETDCNPGGSAPSGVTLAGFVPERLDLRAGEGPGTVELRLSEAPKVHVWVALTTDNPGIARPQTAGVCFAPESASQTVTVEPVDAGSAVVLAKLGTGSFTDLPVSVAAQHAPAILAGLTPSRFVAKPGTQVEMKVTLDRAAEEETTVSLTPIAEGLSYPETLAFPAGSISKTFVVQVDPDAPLRTQLEVRATLGTTTKTANLRAAQLVISEVQIADVGFIEIHNPTNEVWSLDGLSVRVGKPNPGAGTTVSASFASGTEIPPGGFQLCAMTSAFPESSSCQLDADALLSESELEVALTEGAVAVDALLLKAPSLPVPTDFSWERRAWDGITGAQMEGGDHAGLGNGWDTDSNADFQRREVPEPQGGGVIERLPLDG